MWKWHLALLGGWVLMGVCSAEDIRMAKGDYEVAVTENGIEAKCKGVAFIVASHLNISKPEWKGNLYLGRDLPASKTAKLEKTGDRIVISDSVPEIEGKVTHEIRMDESGLLISVKLAVGKDIPRSPVEYVPAVFPADVFAGERYRATSLLGSQDWQLLPAEKPKETGPGTKSILGSLFGLELAGKGLAVNVESVQGPPPSFYDMRSREYTPAEKNYWLLYSWQAVKGEMSVQTRISARSMEAPIKQSQKNDVFIIDGRNRQEVRGIVVDRAAHEVEKAAAKELQQYIAKMCGCEVPIIESGNRRPFYKGAIYVGKGKAAKDGFLFFNAFFDDNEFTALGPDGFILRSKGGNVLAAGKNHRGTVYAVYRLLEKVGCRFFADELEIVPASASVEIPGPFDVKDSAAFEWRAMSGTIAPMKCGLSPGEWTAQVAGVDLPKMMGFPKGGFWHHTMGFLLPAEDLAKSHPEYLALLSGERRAAGAAVQQYCISNPHLLRRMTDAVLDWIAGDPDRLYYPVHYGDVVKFCECEKCKAFCEEKGGLTDAVIWFDNQIAKEVARKFPGKFVTILAYHSTRRAPVKVKPEPNLLIIFCAIVECQGRPWSAPINMRKDVCKDLEDWIAVHPLGAKGIISFDYPTTYHFAGFPYPALYAFVENIRYYKNLGLRGVYVCGLGRWKHLEHVYSYVVPRIMWKPDRDMGALIDEFTQAWYGLAWKPMREYIEMLHRGAMESQSEGVMDCHAGPGQRFFKDLYTPEFLARAEALLDSAEALTNDPFIKRRIEKEKWGLLFVDLFLHGQKGGDLVPVAGEEGIERKTAGLQDYKKMAEFLRINRLFNRPWDMEPRRKFTLSSIVGLEPTSEPWWTCPAIEELMENPDAAHAKQAQVAQELSRKFVTLENQYVKVNIIPRLGGRIWRLYDKGAKQDILWRGTVPLSVIERGLAAGSYVNLGGYEEYTGEKFGSPGWAEAYECKPSPDGRAAALTTALPSGLKLTRTISLTAGRPGIEIDSVLENASKQAIKDVVLRAHPEFLRRSDDTDLQFSVKGEDGGEKRMALKSEAFLSGKQLPRGAWGVTLPKRGIRISNEFDPAQVGACFPYIGPEFFNLELFSPKKDLAPGEKLGIKHRYIISHAKP